MILQRTSADIFNQLTLLLKQLDKESYSRPLPILSNNTIGKHYRHVIEFFECMIQGLKTDIVDYDNRVRNLLLETDPIYTNARMEELSVFINNIEENQALQLNFSYGDGAVTTINTLLYREMAYNIEHAIHHMAIIKIAVEQELPHLTLLPNFGVAYSTLQYQETCAQ
jgi:hypothetical protein